MVVLQSMWTGPNHFWNFMESGSESATYAVLAFLGNSFYSQVGGENYFRDQLNSEDEASFYHFDNEAQF